MIQGKIFRLKENSMLLADVERTQTVFERTRGLLGRDGLSRQQGLLITSCNAIHTFFMRFPIDVVFLNRQYRIEKITPQLVPFRLASCRRASMVLEMRSGTAAKAQLACGEKLRWERSR